ncbi:MAG TPA: class II aldolase/adducin family protein [Acidimicrobiia bacterium]|jgi:ribulose-5-phosphate 4-epimerase/fuculose-1-phosphate aldolase|nr:class II aldolase/adducin family protein [Acidimicrobiia bacterium]
MDEGRARDSIVAAARMMSAAGLAEAFGHVSIRWGDGFLITSTLPFATAGPEDVVLVPDLADPPSGGGNTPLETPMHAAVYAARADVNAICRGHPPAVVAWGVGTESVPLFHGLGALAGERVDVHDNVQLVSTSTHGAAVAETLGDGHAVVLRANGCLAAGATPLEALTRLYFLEERARIALTAGRERETTDWQRRLADTAAELPRAMAWVAATFGPS